MPVLIENHDIRSKKFWFPKASNHFSKPFLNTFFCEESIGFTPPRHLDKLTYHKINFYNSINIREIFSFIQMFPTISCNHKTFINVI